MSESTFYPADLLSEVEILPEDAIALEPDQITQAANLSHSAKPSQQWQTYLNALALFSFQQWLQQRDREIRLNHTHCSLMQPEYAGEIAAVCNLEANQFKLCLIAISELDDTISIPRAAIDLPEFAAHFYIVLEVHEEQQQAMIRGVLRHDQLMPYQQSRPVSPDADWTYPIPFTWFETDPDLILLHLRCLEPTAIPLPEIPSDRAATLSNLQTELLPLLPQLQSSDLPWWQILTWEQGVTVLTSPDLMEWVNNQQPETAFAPSLPNLFQFLTQQAVNAGLWIQNQWDEVAQEVAWMLLPPPATTSMLRATSQTSLQRSPGEELEAIMQELARNGLHLPSQPRGAYRDWLMANIPLRLYAVVGEIPPVEQTPEWTLILVLGAQPGAVLPQGISLEISDLTGVLVERTLDTQTNADYLFAQVSGTWDEKFLISITLPEGDKLTLPPFSFQPRE